MKRHEQIDHLARVTSENLRDLEHDMASLTVLIELLAGRIRELECRMAEIDGCEAFHFTNLH